MTTVRLIPSKAFNRTLARLPEVRTAVQDAATDIGRRAEADLASHRDTGNSSISVEHDRIDSYVHLTDPGGNAMSIEHGHSHYGHSINGLHILAHAAGLI